MTELMEQLGYKGFIVGLELSDIDIDKIAFKYLSKDEYTDCDNCKEYMLRYLSTRLGHRGAFIQQEDYDGDKSILGIAIEEGEIDSFIINIESAKNEIKSIFDCLYPIAVRVLEIE